MAVEEEVINQVMTGAANMGSGAYDVLFWLLIATIFIGLGVFIWWILQFKHKIIVRYLTKRGAFIIQDKARTYRENGVVYWKFFKGKVTATPPPKTAINITKKGKLFAECYITEDNREPVWIKDKGYRKKDLEKSGFRPLTTQQRALTVSRIRKAESRKGASLWDKVAQIALPAMAVIMVMIPFMFWGEITKTSMDAQRAAGDLAEQNAQISEQNARMLSVLAGKLEAGEIDIKQDIPPDAPAEGGG